MLDRAGPRGGHVSGAGSVPWTQARGVPCRHFPQVPTAGLAPSCRAAGPDPRAALLTALAGGPVLRRTLVQDLLLPVMILIGLAVSAGTDTDAALEGAAAQHLSTVGGTASTVSFGSPQPCLASQPTLHCDGPRGQD